MELSIIIVNWNSAEFISQCVKSIEEQTTVAYEIIVVDNASTREDLEKLKEHCPQVNLIACAENLGFARANNLGFQHSSGDYILFLNPDTKVIGPALNTMLREIRLLPQAGVLGCKLLNSDMSVQLSAIQRFPTILNQVFDVEYLQVRWPKCPLWNVAPLLSNDGRLTEVEVVSGACMLIRRKVFEQVGMFSDDYFMYAEDVDLSYKIHCQGFTNYYFGAASIIHHGGKSSCQQEVSYWPTTMRYKAMRQLLGKTKGRLYGSAYRAAMGCAALVRLSLLALAAPFGNRIYDQQSLRFATGKWKVVLMWAIGR